MRVCSKAFHLYTTPAFGVVVCLHHWVFSPIRSIQQTQPFDLWAIEEEEEEARISTSFVRISSHNYILLICLSLPIVVNERGNQTRLDE